MGIFHGSKYTYFSIFATDIIGFLSGVAVSWTSPVLVTLKDDDNLSEIPLGRVITEEEGSWISSLLSIGAIFGSLLFGIVVQRIGRKKTAVAISLPFLISFAILAFAQTVYLYYVGRFIMGIGTGGVFCVLPIYISESVEDINRGLFLATKTSFITMGFLVSYCIGPYVSIMVLNLLLVSLCVLFIPFFWILVPESAWYLVSIGKDEEAFKSLRHLRRRPSIELRKELEKIQSHYSETTTQGSFLDIFKIKGTRKAFFYMLALIIFQQLTGVAVIAAYTQTIFEATGSNIRSDISSIIIGVTQTVVSTGSTPLLDKLGRRALLLVVIIGIVIADTLLGIYFFLKDNGNDVSNIGWLPLVGLLVYTLFYNMGVGPIPWALMGELLPINVRPKAALIITSFYFFTSFLITKYFPTISSAINMAIPFWFFAGSTILFEIFVFCFIFETNGKSFKEIQDLLNK